MLQVTQLLILLGKMIRDIFKTIKKINNYNKKDYLALSFIGERKYDDGEEEFTGLSNLSA